MKIFDLLAAASRHASSPRPQPNSDTHRHRTRPRQVSSGPLPFRTDLTQFLNGVTSFRSWAYTHSASARSSPRLTGKLIALASPVWLLLFFHRVHQVVHAHVIHQELVGQVGLRQIARPAFFISASSLSLM